MIEFFFVHRKQPPLETEIQEGVVAAADEARDAQQQTGQTEDALGQGHGLFALQLVPDLLGQGGRADHAQQEHPHPGQHGVGPAHGPRAAGEHDLEVGQGGGEIRGGEEDPPDDHDDHGVEMLEEGGQALDILAQDRLRGPGRGGRGAAGGHGGERLCPPQLRGPGPGADPAPCGAERPDRRCPIPPPGGLLPDGGAEMSPTITQSWRRPTHVLFL